MKIFNYLRNLKTKLTHDNLFDIAFGGLLACLGLYIYLNTADMAKLIIIVVPALFSFFNELVNIWQGQKKFMISDVLFRCVIGVVIYLIV